MQTQSLQVVRQVGDLKEPKHRLAFEAMDRLLWFQWATSSQGVLAHEVLGLLELGVILWYAHRIV